MSRIYYSESNSDYPQLEYGRFERARQQVLAGKPGKRTLRELEAALLALPEKRLIDDDLICGGYQEPDDLPITVCALGALALHKGIAPDELQAANDCYEGDWEMATWAAARLGMTQTLAWVLMELNDELNESVTPEERYVNVLAWVRKQLEQTGTAADGQDDGNG